MMRIASWAQRNGAVRLVATTAFQVSYGKSSRGTAGAPMPALLKSTSRRPNVSAIFVKRVSICDFCVRSAGTTRVFEGCAIAAVFSSSAARRPASTTLYPSEASARLTARPIPLPAPVTSATRSFAISMTVTLRNASGGGWYLGSSEGGSMKIGVLGAGNVGGALGKRWAKAGHEVHFGVRNPAAEDVTALLGECAGHGSAGEPRAAIDEADVVVCALPWSAVLQALSALDLKGKILLDCSNPLKP